MAARNKITTRRITLTGLTPVMFDRYAGDNKTQLSPDQKFYRGEGNQIVLPSYNLMSLLTATNTTSAPKRFLDKRAYKDVCQAILSHVMIRPENIPFLRDGEPIVFGAFDEEGMDAASGMYVRHDVARLKDGVPNPKTRPVLPLPWQLAFELDYMKNTEVTEQQVKNLLDDAGPTIGIGTFRGVFGKFVLDAWE
jgi:hypothetical protein